MILKIRYMGITFQKKRYEPNNFFSIPYKKIFYEVFYNRVLQYSIKDFQYFMKDLLVLAFSSTDDINMVRYLLFWNVNCHLLSQCYLDCK